jgi:hypothetical protein
MEGEGAMAQGWESAMDRIKRDYDLLRWFLEREGAVGVPASPPPYSVKIKSPFRNENTASFQIRRIPEQSGQHQDLCDRDVPAPRRAPEPRADGGAGKDGRTVLVLISYGNKMREKGVRMEVNRKYLASRGLSPRVYRHLYDVAYRSSAEPARTLYGVGLPNRMGDWNVRNGMKSKALSKCLVEGLPEQRVNGGGGGCTIAEIGPGRAVDVVEGMLSGMALVDAGFAVGKLLILNGGGNDAVAARTLARTAAVNPDVQIRLHLDGDKIGNKARATILDAVPSALDLSYLYVGRGDPLDFWAADRNGMQRALNDALREAQHQDAMPA